LKSFFIASIPFQRFHRRLLTRFTGRRLRDVIEAAPRPPAYLIRVPMVPELFDVVHHALALRLPINLAAPAQREAIDASLLSR
jgi:hypothetical protein